MLAARCFSTRQLRPNRKGFGLIRFDVCGLLRAGSGGRPSWLAVGGGTCICCWVRAQQSGRGKSGRRARGGLEVKLGEQTKQNKNKTIARRAPRPPFSTTRAGPDVPKPATVAPLRQNGDSRGHAPSPAAKARPAGNRRDGKSLRSRPHRHYRGPRVILCAGQKVDLARDGWRWP